jgi:hypothetical protein
MPSRPGPWWRSPAVVLVGAALALVATAAGLASARLPADFVALLAPLVAYSVPLLLILAARLESGPGRPSGGDLDHLLDRKRSGDLPPAGRAPPRAPGPPAATRPAATDWGLDDDLDRLVRRKRRSAGRPDQRAGEPPAPREE